MPAAMDADSPPPDPPGVILTLSQKASLSFGKSRIGNC